MGKGEHSNTVCEDDGRTTMMTEEKEKWRNRKRNKKEKELDKKNIK